MEALTNPNTTNKTLVCDGSFIMRTTGLEIKIKSPMISKMFSRPVSASYSTSYGRLNDVPNGFRDKHLDLYKCLFMDDYTLIDQYDRPNLFFLRHRDLDNGITIKFTRLYPDCDIKRYPQLFNDYVKYMVNEYRVKGGKW